jgi:putative ABC transport system ATP-binding protein
MTSGIEATAIGRRDRKSGGWLIRGVSVSVRFGERLGVLGPSGAGKTVLLRAIAQLDPLDEGSIRWQGRAVHGDDIPAYRRRVVYLHQRPALLEGTVEDNLRYPFTLRAHRERTFDPDRIENLLAQLGREPGFLAKKSRDLSGGESQLVGLIRAVQLDPAVLLLDEPTASLDPATTRAVEGLLDDWMAANPAERALVWVSHDADQARRMTGRRLHLRAGRLESEESDRMEGPCAEIGFPFGP